MVAESANPSVHEFCRLWTDSFVAVLNQLGVAAAKGSFTYSPQESAAQPVSAPGASVRFAGGASLRGELLCQADAPAGLQLSQTLMSETLQPEAAFGDEQKDAFAEFVRQAAGLVATGWKSATGAETILSFHSAVEPAFPPSPSAQLSLTGTAFPEIRLTLWLTDRLVQAIESQSTAAGSAAAETPSASAAAPAAAPSADSPLAGGGNLDLLLDVELDATIRFGEREMLLRDVLNLLPGAVVELNQVVNEPADLLVAGRLIARGEVVVVDGNFGLRVTEVASRSQRAAALPF